jgi:hypothetical protein
MVGCKLLIWDYLNSLVGDLNFIVVCNMQHWKSLLGVKVVGDWQFRYMMIQPFKNL